MQAEELTQLAIDALEDVKAKDILTIDVRGKSNVTDIMIIASGGSSRQVKALADKVVEKAKDAGVDVTLKVGEGMFHCYPACAPLFPEASQAMAEMCAFIKAHLN